MNISEGWAGTVAKAQQPTEPAAHPVRDRPSAWNGNTTYADGIHDECLSVNCDFLGQG
jgi:hypothetical protein